MDRPSVTVVMGPRERHSGLVPCIESLFEHTPPELFRLVVVQGDLPPHVRTSAEDAAGRLGFTFEHRDHPLRPNEARNIGLTHVDTPWTVFSDNDVQFTDGWLEHMLDAAEAHDAWLVTPVITHGRVELGKVHVAGPELVEEPDAGHTRHRVIQRHMFDDLDEIRPTLVRETRNDVEFHVLLARSDIFDTIGPLDESVIGRDHTDFARAVVQAGGTIVFEPEAIVGYLGSNTDPAYLEPSDVPFYLLRFSDVWNDATFETLQQKWDMAPGSPMPDKLRHWLRYARMLAYEQAHGRAVAKLASPKLGVLGDQVDRYLFKRHTGPLLAKRRAAGRPA